MHGPQIDQVLAEETADGEVRWALTNNQGTIRDVIDNQGTILNHITYDSFGQITSQTNAEAYFRFGFTGREYDQESGQYYYRARYFDPTVGRFISEDPIGFNGGDANVYRYVFNSPLNYTDPSGNFAITGTIVVGGLFVVASVSTLAYLQNNINELSKDIRSSPFPSDDGFFDRPSSITGDSSGQFHPDNINERQRYTSPLSQDGVIDRVPASNDGSSSNLGGFGENQGISIPSLETFPQNVGDLSSPYFDNNSEWKIPDSVVNKIPNSWGPGVKNKKKTGTRWLDPVNNKANGVRIDQGDPNSLGLANRLITLL